MGAAASHTGSDAMRMQMSWSSVDRFDREGDPPHSHNGRHVALPVRTIVQAAFHEMETL